MHAVGTASRKEHITECQSYVDGLILHTAFHSGILQILVAGVAGFIHDLKELIEFSCAQRGSFLLSTLVVHDKVHGTHKRAVTAFLTDLSGLSQQVLCREAAQVLLSEQSRDTVHLRGDRGIGVCQIRMAGAGIDDAERVALLCQIEIDLLDHRLLHVRKVDGDDSAHRGSGLVHQAAGLAEPDILGLLAHLGDLHSIKGIAAEKVVEDDTGQGLECRGRRKTGSAQHAAGAVGIKAADSEAALFCLSRHAADQRSGGLFFGFNRICIREADLDHAVALGIEADHILAIRCCSCDCIQVYARCQHTAPLMVSVISTDLRTAGRAVKSHLCRRIFRESLIKAFRHPGKTLRVNIRLRSSASVHFLDPAVDRARAQLLCQCLPVIHFYISPFQNFLFSCLDILPYGAMIKRHLSPLTLTTLYYLCSPSLHGIIDSLYALDDIKSISYAG